MPRSIASRCLCRHRSPNETEMLCIYRNNRAPAITRFRTLIWTYRVLSHKRVINYLKIAARNVKLQHSRFDVVFQDHVATIFFLRQGQNRPLTCQLTCLSAYCSQKKSISGVCGCDVLTELLWINRVWRPSH